MENTDVQNYPNNSEHSSQALVSTHTALIPQGSFSSVNFKIFLFFHLLSETTFAKVLINDAVFVSK